MTEKDIQRFLAWLRLESGTGKEWLKLTATLRAMGPGELIDLQLMTEQLQKVIAQVRDG